MCPLSGKAGAETLAGDATARVSPLPRFVRRMSRHGSVAAYPSSVRFAVANSFSFSVLTCGRKIFVDFRCCGKKEGLGNVQEIL